MLEVVILLFSARTYQCFFLSLDRGCNFFYLELCIKGLPSLVQLGIRVGLFPFVYNINQHVLPVLGHLLLFNTKFKDVRGCPMQYFSLNFFHTLSTKGSVFSTRFSNLRLAERYSLSRIFIAFLFTTAKEMMGEFKTIALVIFPWSYFFTIVF